MSSDFEIFAVASPGLEAVLCAEVRDKGFAQSSAVTGGVSFMGGWRDVWRANLDLRGAARILARIASFRAMHLAQLDKRARKVAWAEVLSPDVPVRIEASCTKSRIYHAGAAAQRVGRAIAEELGAPIDDKAELCVKVRIDDDLCTISIDCSGEGLHRRGHKLAVNKAPMRETLAAMFLRMCGFDGQECVVDPMCGSGTFVIEAAEIAAGLKPGRTRRFAFESLAGFDRAAWQAMRDGGAPTLPAFRFFGSDRDAGAIEMSRANALRAGVAAFTDFRQATVSELTAPEGSPGLVIVNPPYGERIGEASDLRALYDALGQTLRVGFAGWRVGLITSDPVLARAAGLPFGPPSAPISHGGLRVKLYSTGPLA